MIRVDLKRLKAAFVSLNSNSENGICNQIEPFKIHKRNKELKWKALQFW